MNCRIAKLYLSLVFAVSLLEYGTLLGRIKNDVSTFFNSTFVPYHTTVYHMHYQGYLINLDIW
jgi:hypothetical protein